MEKLIPAPWDLTGRGYIMFFKFPPQFIREFGFLDGRFQKGFHGKTGCIIFGDYQQSKVGPYQELFFVPGKIHYHHRNLYTISKVFGSTAESVENARQNWGIPKELAAFSVTQVTNNLENIKVTQNGVPVIDITIRTPDSGLPLPLNTFFMPFPLVQHMDGKTYYLNVKGHGSGRLGQILKVEVNPELFPNFAFFKHVAIIKVNRFQVRFPVPKIKKEAD
ncbi:MAG: hypothetical protein ACM3X9_15300 [Bacillota bacterium]